MTAVQPITPGDRALVATTLARAFADDPVMAWLTGDRPARFERAAQGFFAETARKLASLGGGWMTGDGKAVALWAPPGLWHLGPVDTLRLVPGAARLYGTRLLKAARVLGEMESVHPSEPHWYLSFLGADPSFQGKGYGGAVIRPVLERCDRDGLPAYLESSNERNIPFYERHGFEVTGKHTFLGGPPLIPMWRPAG